MPVSICTRCMSQLHLQSPRNTIRRAVTSLSQTSSFHTTTSALAAGPAVSKHKVKYRDFTPASHKGKGRERKKLPAVGERRQLRDRIVLSNTNALEVTGLEDLSRINFNSSESVGRMLGFDGQVIDQLRELKAFKRTQNWSLFRKPAALMRTESGEVAKMIEGVMRASSGGEPETKRMIITGGQAAGKSIMLLQAQAMALVNHWVVISVHDAQQYVNDHFAYAPLPKSNEDDIQLYQQSTLAAALLQRTANANATVLAKLKPNNAPPKNLSLDSSSTKNLHTIALAGAEKPTIAHATLEYLLSELTTSGAEHRPPLLLTIDGLDHWMGPSKYHAADHSIIHSHQFATIRTFLSKLFNSTTNLGNGGIALAATTASNTPAFPTFAPLLNQVTALSNGTAPTDPSFPLPAPYQKVDSAVLGLLDPKAQTQIMQLKGVSRAEAGTLLGYYWRSGVLQEPLSAADVAERWTLAGGGVVGELARIGQSARIDVNKVLTKWGSAEGVKQGQGEHRPRR